MNVGDTIRVRTLRCIPIHGKGWVEFKPDEEKKEEKQKVFVLLLLGTEAKHIKSEEERLNRIKALESFGWRRKK